MSPQEQAVLTLAREAAHGIFRRWKLIVGVYLGIVLVAVSGIFVLPPIYRTAGKILLTTDRAEVSAATTRLRRSCARTRSRRAR